MRYLKDFLTYAEEHYGDKIVAYMLCGGSTYEWLDWLHGLTTVDKDKAWAEWQKTKCPWVDSPFILLLRQLNHSKICLSGASSATLSSVSVAPLRFFPPPCI